MAEYTTKTRPGQFRLPMWAHEYLQERAARYGTTKTEVVLEALECLRDRELEELMAEGYREVAALDSELAERNVGIAAETLPDW